MRTPQPSTTSFLNSPGLIAQTLTALAMIVLPGRGSHTPDFEARDTPVPKEKNPDLFHKWLNQGSAPEKSNTSLQLRQPPSLSNLQWCPFANYNKPKETEQQTH